MAEEAEDVPAAGGGRALAPCTQPAGVSTGRTRKGKAVHWSTRREEKFLAALAETSCIAASIRASGLSESNVYRRRRSSAEFRARWAAALREGYAKLESEMLDRALNGVERDVWHGGRKVGTMREYNDRLALALLAAHRASVVGADDGDALLSETEMRDRLAQRLGAMNRAMGGAG